MSNTELPVSATLESLEWRYATKSYDASKKLTAEQLNLIKESLRLSPSSFGLQAWKFVHVTDPALREQLKGAAWGQTQLTDASELFVLASYTSIDEAFVDKYIASIAETRGIPAESLKGFRDMMVGTISGRTPAELKEWLGRQVYIPLGVALTVAAEHEIDATPMEGFDPKQFDELLGLAPLGLTSRVILAVGFRSADDATQSYKKSRFPEAEVFIER